MTSKLNKDREPYKSRSDAQLRGRITELRAEAEPLRRRLHKTRADAHARVDELVESARAQIRAIFRAGIHTLATINDAASTPSIGDLYALCDPEIVRAWHEEIDRESQPGEIDTFGQPGDPDGPEIRKLLDANRREREAIEAELDLRVIDAEFDSANKRRTAALKKIGAAA